MVRAPHPRARCPGALTHRSPRRRTIVPIDDSAFNPTAVKTSAGRIRGLQTRTLSRTKPPISSPWVPRKRCISSACREYRGCGEPPHRTWDTHRGPEVGHRRLLPVHRLAPSHIARLSPFPVPVPCRLCPDPSACRSSPFRRNHSARSHPLCRPDPPSIASGNPEGETLGGQAAHGGKPAPPHRWAPPRHI